jgi:hypothetical protein
MIYHGGTEETLWNRTLLVRFEPADEDINRF